MNLRVVGVNVLQALRTHCSLEVADANGNLPDIVVVPREVADAFLRLAGEPALPPEPPLTNPWTGKPAEVPTGAEAARRAWAAKAAFAAPDEPTIVGG